MAKQEKDERWTSDLTDEVTFEEEEEEPNDNIRTT